MKLYKIEFTALNADGSVEFMVIRKSDKVRVFFGTKTECREWIENNGHDDWN